MHKKILFLFLLLLASISRAASVELVQIKSEKMNRDIPVNVILPDGYNKSIRDLPVLYLLHGAGDDYNGWVKKTEISQLADQYNIIVVCPDGGKTSWYFDSPIDASYQYETFIAIELIEYIDKNYRTLASKDFRAISGLSMGGHGALFLAIRHSKTFGYVGSQSGGVDFRGFANHWDIKKRIGPYEENKELWDEMTVINQAKSLKDNELKIYIDCGSNDFFIDGNRRLHQQLLDAKISHIYTERPGGHNWDYWANSIKYQMLFFSECFKQAKIESQKSSE